MRKLWFPMSYLILNGGRQMGYKSTLKQTYLPMHIQRLDKEPKDEVVIATDRKRLVCWQRSAVFQRSALAQSVCRQSLCSDSMRQKGFDVTDRTPNFWYTKKSQMSKVDDAEIRELGRILQLEVNLLIFLQRYIRNVLDSFVK